VNWKINEKWKLISNETIFPDKIYRRNRSIFNYQIRFVIYPHERYVTVSKYVYCRLFDIILGEKHYLHAYKKWYKLLDRFIDYLGLGYYQISERLNIQEANKKYNINISCLAKDRDKKLDRVWQQN
jgi:hypothetical protein